VRRFPGRSSRARAAKAECSLAPESSEEAARLLRAARSDLRAAEALAADRQQENDVVGFHAQPAIEQAIKAALVASGSEIPYSHDLDYLLDIVAQEFDGVLEPVAEADWLTLWAVAARYGISAASLDRGAALVAANEAVSWASPIAAG
jgi:HEPN domain-containing protein